MKKDIALGNPPQIKLKITQKVPQLENIAEEIEQILPEENLEVLEPVADFPEFELENPFYEPRPETPTSDTDSVHSEESDSDSTMVATPPPPDAPEKALQKIVNAIGDYQVAPYMGRDDPRSFSEFQEELNMKSQVKQWTDEEKCLQFYWHLAPGSEARDIYLSLPVEEKQYWKSDATLDPPEASIHGVTNFRLNPPWLEPASHTRGRV